MKILVLTGSPHKKGTSAMMADYFIEGAKNTGNEVVRLDTAFMNINSCLGCGYCRKNNEKCVQDDDMKYVTKELLEADMVVFVTPLYYFGITAQLKKVIDRFFAPNETLRTQNKKAMLLVTGAADDEIAMKAIKLHYWTMLKYLNWQDSGILVATGMRVREEMENSEFPEKGRKLGESIK